MDNDKDLSDLFHNKPRVFVPSDSYHIGNHITDFKASALMFIDAIKRVADNHVLQVSKDRANIAMDMVSGATRVMLAYKDQGVRRELTTEQKRTVLAMAEDILNGKREAVQFQLTRDCEGIREIFTGQVMHPGTKDKILPVEFYTKKK